MRMEQPQPQPQPPPVCAGVPQRPPAHSPLPWFESGSPGSLWAMAWPLMNSTAAMREKFFNMFVSSWWQAASKREAGQPRVRIEIKQKQGLSEMDAKQVGESSHQSRSPLGSPVYAKAGLGSEVHRILRHLGRAGGQEKARVTGVRMRAILLGLASVSVLAIAAGGGGAACAGEGEGEGGEGEGEGDEGEGDASDIVLDTSDVVRP